MVDLTATQQPWGDPFEPRQSGHSRGCLQGSPLRRSKMACVALLAMLFHMAFALGHIDGPIHKEGSLFAGFERLLAGDREGAASRHHDNNSHGYCDLCIIGSLGAALPAPPAMQVLSELTFHTIDWIATGARPHTPETSRYHEIRGPPRV